MIHDVPTPAILIDAPTVRRNLKRLASYAHSHQLKLRPHTKTHKSLMLARLQMEFGAAGLTVAKVGEAAVMAEAADDILMAYPAVDAARCAELAKLAQGRMLRVGIDSVEAAEALSLGATAAGTSIGVLVELDVGFGRTGVQSVPEALALAQEIDRRAGLRLDGMMFFPGHLTKSPEQHGSALKVIDERLAEVIGEWKKHGLAAEIVSGGSTPTAYQSHVVTRMTEIRPGTYVFNDMNCVHGGCAALEDCAARIVATVVSNAVAGQVVIDAGTKTLTSDRCGPAPDSGHGYIVEYPDAKVAKLSEEHGQVDVSRCDKRPKVGERVTVIPNHICPCVNLQNHVWWKEEGHAPVAVTVEARGKVF